MQIFTWIFRFRRNINFFDQFYPSLGNVFFTFSTHIEGLSTGAEQSIRKCNHVSFNPNVLHILFRTLQELLQGLLKT